MHSQDEWMPPLSPFSCNTFRLHANHALVTDFSIPMLGFSFFSPGVFLFPLSRSRGRTLF